MMQGWEDLCTCNTIQNIDEFGGRLWDGHPDPPRPLDAHWKEDQLPHCYDPRLSYWEELLSEGALNIYRTSYYGPWSKVGSLRGSDYVPDPVRIYNFEAEGIQGQTAQQSHHPKPNDYFLRHEKYMHQLYEGQDLYAAWRANRRESPHSMAPQYSATPSYSERHDIPNWPSFAMPHSWTPYSHEPHSASNPSSLMRGTQIPPLLPYQTGYMGSRSKRPTLFPPAYFAPKLRTTSWRSPHTMIAYSASGPTHHMASSNLIVPASYWNQPRRGQFERPYLAHPAKVNTYTWGINANSATKHRSSISGLRTRFNDYLGAIVD
eukprot:GGOE01004938.1.p1 GENE.GGOE01004938.1~~GGOE01004938.1.p1  ORF type:complete len:319 (-),score=17.50 GGOE01004938.1:468-1424(-)